jgi:hypothetical protein
MIQSNQSCDPVIHRAAMKLARQCAEIIGLLLRQEQKPQAVLDLYPAIRDAIESLIWHRDGEVDRGESDREFYVIIRDGFEEFPKGEMQ